ncbi:MAG TPA: SMP-30/gluconolactonase/LRE family protein [Blastocatellia bacterium]|nr:SMP-30/gluconolactonase/LRE family protein [Blastocatellia bacterium]
MRKAVAYSLAAIITLSLLILPGIKGRSTVLAQSEAPRLKTVRPDKITAGAPTFTVRLEGRNFATGAKVLFDGVPLASSRVAKKGKFLLAEVDASAVASPGSHTVRAVNPDGMTTDALTLSVVAPDPELSIRLPQNSVQEDSGFVFLPFVEGQGLDKIAKVFVWGKSTEFQIVNDESIQIQIPAGMVDEPARIPVMVRDKKDNLSNTEIFFVVPRPANISNFDPETIEVGSPDTLIKVFGDFKDNAVIVVNGIPLPTTMVKQRLEATIPASFFTQPAQLTLRLDQDGIQSEDQIITVTPTDAPFIFTIAPVLIRQGENRATIDIVGANFNGKSEAFIDGEEVKIRDNTKRRLTVVVPKDLLSAVGTHTVQVKDADGNVTQTVTFRVVPDVTVSTLAGGKLVGFNSETCVSGEDALFRRPRRLALGPDGLLYVTDQQNHAIRSVNTATGETCTVAGTGVEGYKDSGDSTDPPTFSFPNGVDVDSNGVIYVTENGNNVVRRIVRTGSGVTVSTFAGSFDMITNEDTQKRLNSTRRGINGFRSSTLLDSNFRLPDDILVAPDGAIYVADAGNHVIRRIRQNVVETIAGNGVPGFADGVAENARFDTPTALEISADGRFLFVADTRNNRIRKIDLLNNRVDTFAGSGRSGNVDGPRGEASFSVPIGLALDQDGLLYVSEVGGNDIRRVDAQGNVSTLTGNGSKFKDGPGLDAKFDSPHGLAIDVQRGILYVADQENSRIRKITLR